MQALVVQRRHKITQTLRAYRHAAAHPVWPWHIDLIDVDGQFLAIPVQAAGSNLKMIFTAVNALTAALGHGPALCAFAIQGHIQSAEVFRIDRVTLKASSQSIVRRKNTADKSDDGQAMFAILT